MSLKNKIAVITGGSRGIGKATAIALANEGCKIVICSKNVNNLTKARKELEEMGADVLAVTCDLTKLEDIKKFADAVKKKFGKIDILVNNAGVAYYKNLIENKEEEINELLDVNVRGLILTTKYFLPLMNKNGTIINISSGAGKSGYGGLAVYCASKFAVIGFTESLAQELKGVKVISLCPGGVDTDMYMSLDETRHPALKPEHIAAKIVEICAEPEKFKSGSSVEVYHVTDALNHLRMKYFRK